MNDTSSPLARPEAEVDDHVAHSDSIGVMLDHYYRVSLVTQLLQNRDEPLVIPRMQANRRLVEHVEGADQSRTQR